MRKLFWAALFVVLAVIPTNAATLTCTIAGSAISGANNSRALNINDTDLQSVLNWLAATQLQLIANQFNGGVVNGFTPTNAQLEWGWFQASIVVGTKQAVQQWATTPAVPPAQIGLQ